MVDLSVTTIRSEAARVGFLRESTQELKDLVESRIEARTDSALERLSLKRANAANKLETVKKRLHRHYAEHISKMQWSELAAGACGLFLGVVMLYIGARLPSYLSLTPLLYGVSGALLIRFTGVDVSSGKLLIISFFSTIGALTVMLLQWSESVPWQEYVISGTAAGCSAYVMNLIILKSVAATFQQFSIIVGNCRKWILERSGKYWKIQYNTLNNRYVNLLDRKTTEQAKMLALIEYEALLGQLAKQVKIKKQMKSPLPSIVEQEFSYVE